MLIASGDNLWMEDDESAAQPDGELEFQDAADDFPFHDCVEGFTEPIGIDGSSSISGENPSPSSAGEATSQAGLRRRRSHSHDKSFGSDSNESSMAGFSVTLKNELNSGEGRRRRSLKIRDYENQAEESGSSEITHLGADKDERNGERATLLTSGENDNTREDLAREESSLRGTDGADSTLLLTLAGIVIKLITFQIHLWVNLFTFPVRLVYYLYMFVFDPFAFWSRCKLCLTQKMKGILSVAFQSVMRSAYEWIKEHQAVWKLGLKCGWGLLWSAYVCGVLVVLLLSAFVMGGILIRTVVVEPVRITRGLNFDYVEKSPVAYVPLTVEPEVSDVFIGETVEFGKISESRVIQHNHKFKVGVSLTLPESDYNRNLGIFQVRVDLLSADGKILASSKRPCMLPFKSQPIRLLLTLFKLAPILTGYTTEAQNLRVNFRGFTEGDVPTAYLRVVVEQRAEFFPGAGIPEIYDASLTLESELPLLLHVLWFWKKTLFVWTSMAIFGVELLFALLCCKPLVLPKIHLRDAANGDAPQNDRRARR